MKNPQHLDRWAHLRFSIIGPLLAAPPAHGELSGAIKALVKQDWRHPVDGTVIRFSFATLERWYYLARSSSNPVTALRRCPRHDAGSFRQIPAALIPIIQAQYLAHPGWTVQLHYDNLKVLARTNLALQPLPSYGTLRRYMKAQGLHRQRKPKRQTPAARQAEHRLQQREVRSYETDYVHSLWHTDFHHGSRRVLTANGHWETPLLLCFIDDHSRLICHLQWYLSETAEVLVHGLSQALQKRGLPRALMTDNGAAMQAEEFTSGLHHLSILHETTLPYSPYQNAKQENFWATLEGRLMAMLEGVRELTLDQLNEVTQAWVEHEYHRNRHTEIGVTPLERYLDAKQVGRDCPDAQTLRDAFVCTQKRKQRRSDGSISLAGKRYEIPGRYRQLEYAMVRYARWDLRRVLLIDPQTLLPLTSLYPVDKTANAEGHRRALASNVGQEAVTDEQNDELPPLLLKCLEDYAATGNPPAYLPHKQSSSGE